MGKISPVSAKYIIHASITIEGVVDKPDVIGAIFGQTEGLLGNELELRELQRSGRIGRIEVNVDTKGGKSSGVITVPSSLDKAETSIIGAALEIIERIGPCNARIKVEKIEDVRVSKRHYVVNRAKELLKNLVDNSMPDSQELTDEVMYSVRVMEIQEYGKDRLPAGPAVDESDEVIVVEGRADVVNLLKHGIKNAIALNGTSVPETMVELSKKKILTVFVDGDRGGELILKSLLMVADIDYVTRAPDGKEVEEITKKEIHQALRARVVPQQIKLDRSGSAPSSPQQTGGQQHNKEGRAVPSASSSSSSQPQPQSPGPQRRPAGQSYGQHRSAAAQSSSGQIGPSASAGGQQQGSSQQQRQQQQQISGQEKDAFRTMAEELIGTRAAYLLDNKLNILGKVPVSELQVTLEGLNNVNAVVFDGVIEKHLVKVAEDTNVKFVIGMDSRVKQNETPVIVATISEL